MEEKRRKEEALEEIRAYAQETKEEQKQMMKERRKQKQEDKEKYPWSGLRKKARKLRWKRNKVISREELKSWYQDAPWIVRIPRLYLLKPFLILLVIAAVAGLVAFGAMQAMPGVLSAYLETNRNMPVDKEEIYKLSPVDEQGAKRIDAIAPVDKEDTWTISIYLVGADLEDMNENDLSDVVKMQVEDVREKIKKERSAKAKKSLTAFSGELEKNHLEIPSYLYYPNKPVADSGDQENSSGETVAEKPGSASTDIGEITSDTWSDNITVVIQTGGATRWSYSAVNPNRTQRFLYQKGEINEIENLPLQPASKPETLTSFLNFCKEKYPADHNMLVLWNHGGGSFGFGVDSIYGNMMSLADIRQALLGAYKPDENHPAFDIIGFDACLMSSLEVTHALNGFASYYALSEETEPGEGWDYSAWLGAMTKDPTMSPARVAREIADSYTDFYMTQNVNIGWLMTNDVTFSVLDAKKAGELYDAWCDLARQQLSDAAADGSVLAEIGRCSNKSTHYAASAYNVYNTIDLGSYVDLLVDSYPKECGKIKKLLGEAVLYHRENGALSDSQGISVYVPGSVETASGLIQCLDYIYNICEDPSTRALYYYKIAGCLNDEMKEYLSAISKNKPWTLDVEAFTQFAKAKPETTETGFTIPIGEELGSLLQNYTVEAAFLDTENGAIINYGRDETVRLDGDGNMDCEFDGTWICYDGVPLATEVVASTATSVEYRSKILYNGKESYLSFSWDRDTETFAVNGVRGVSSTSLINLDPFNYLVNSRMTEEVKKGDTIVPIYEVDLPNENKDEQPGDDLSHGKEIEVSKKSRIEMGKLPAGYYLTAAVISDQRGDIYYSQVVGNKAAGGKVKERSVDADFVGRDY